LAIPCAIAVFPVPVSNIVSVVSMRSTTANKQNSQCRLEGCSRASLQALPLTFDSVDRRENSSDENDGVLAQIAVL
jgi:hypothetical protein